MKSLKSILESKPLMLNQFSDVALLGEAVITDYSKFVAQHKKMYPSHSEEQIKAAWEKYSNAHSKKEAVAKIACLKCDAVSTAVAWKKNNGFCPVCKVSSQGLAESINEEEDPVELVSAHLSDISEMVDDLYNTFAVIEEKIDENIAKQIEKIYIMVDELYADVDNKYDIVILDEPEIEIDDELEEQLQSLEEELGQEDVADFSNASLSTLKMIGFKRVKESDLSFREVNKLKKGKVRMLFGLPMRAGKWADVFVGTTMNKDKVFYFMHDVSLDDGDLGVFAKESQFLQNFKTMVGSNDIVEKLDLDLEEAAVSDTKWRVAFSYADPSGSGVANARIIVNAKDSETAKRYAETSLKRKGHFKDFKIKSASKMNEKNLSLEDSSDIFEKLDPDSKAGVWIRDFIASKNPKFAGKSKKERIRMALGAWYGAQQNEK